MRSAGKPMRSRSRDAPADLRPVGINRLRFYNIVAYAAGKKLHVTTCTNLTLPWRATVERGSVLCSRRRDGSLKTSGFGCGCPGFSPTPLLNTPPEHCLAIEDGRAGAEAAIAGNMAVVGVGPV